LQVQGQAKGEDALDQGLASIEPAKVGRFIVAINGARAVVPRRWGCWAQSVPPDHRGSDGVETQVQGVVAMCEDFLCGQG
jgi:hypothetical protein